MKTTKDIILRADIIVKAGSNVKGEMPKDYIEPLDGLVDLKIKKRYTILGLTLETGSILSVGEKRASQLQNGGLADINITKTEK